MRLETFFLITGDGLENVDCGPFCVNWQCYWGWNWHVSGVGLPVDFGSAGSDCELLRCICFVVG
jgi:hypothetical protein